jgi:hypothetical protein
MAKRTKKSTKHRQKTAPLSAKDKEIAYLQKLVRYSLNYTHGTSEVLNAIFMEQAHRIAQKIMKLKENQ